MRSWFFAASVIACNAVASAGHGERASALQCRTGALSDRWNSVRRSGEAGAADDEARRGGGAIEGRRGGAAKDARLALLISANSGFRIDRVDLTRRPAVVGLTLVDQKHCQQQMYPSPWDF